MVDYGYKYYQDFLNGDSLGFESLVKEYRNSLVLFIQQYVGDFHVAEDISQDVFVKLYVKKPHYSPKASFKTWLYTIAKRESMNYLKRQKNQADVDLSVLSANEDDYLDCILAEEKQRALYSALGELNSDYRQVLLLCYFDNLSVKDIARLTAKKPRQVSDILYNAKKSLQAIIIKGGIKYEILRPDTK